MSLPFLMTLGSLGAIADVTPPVFVHEPCGAFVAGRSFELRAQIFDDSLLVDPVVYYRAKGADTWQGVPLVPTSATDFSATLPTDAVLGSIEYFLEAFDEHGNGPARFGEPHAPITLDPASNPLPCKQIPETTGSVSYQASSESRAPDMARAAIPFCAEESWYCSLWFWGTAVAISAAVGTSAYFLLREDTPPAPPEPRLVTVVFQGPYPAETQ